MNKEHDLSLKVDHIEWHQVSQEDKRGCGVSGVERLERAKKIIKDMVEFIENVSHIGKEDTEYLDWLVSTVEEQQKEIERLDNEMDGLLTIVEDRNPKAHDLFIKLKQENSKLRKALEGVLKYRHVDEGLKDQLRKVLKK
ncbi:hypothetical protein [Siminovitchia sp. 179-K 8D1 HS]|uniref:hypothetical protein n=1 Tax=Siminovitchia sp. 179-K 8D1 HS TaxID=3142385 RepID=UPI0039A2CF05